MRILLTADPELPVPPVGYGGIERIVDALVRTFKARGHTVGLVANRASTCPADGRGEKGAIGNAPAQPPCAGDKQVDKNFKNDRIGARLEPACAVCR